jgi:outer membrane lipoprotein LolB
MFTYYRPLILFIQSLCLSVSLLNLTGCVSLSLPTKASQASHFQVISPQKRQAQLRLIKTWTIRGAVSYQQNGQTQLANYYWQQIGDDYQISLNSSLNLYHVELDGNAKQVTLIENHKTTVAKRPEELLSQRLSAHLPIRAISYWIRGLAAPGVAKTQYDAFGHLIGVNQQGWDVSFDQYESIDNVDLPQILRIQSRQQHIKLVIKDWNIH